MSYSDDNSFEKILNRVLGNDLLINVDKRVGSIIYDAVAPICLELAEAYVKMDILENQTYLMTATGNNLDKRVYDYGISRSGATKAMRIAEFKKYKRDADGNLVLDNKGNKILIDMNIDVGIRFAVPNSSTTFEYIGKIDNYNIVECEQLGTSGNEHLGQILPLTQVTDMIEAKIISTYKPAEDEETDAQLRTRAVNALNYASFGGNIQDYIERTDAIDGVGETKVFPAWQYNGSVLLSIVDPQYDPITEEFKKNLKEQIDPDDVIDQYGTVLKDDTSGQGIGIAPIGHYVTITTPVKKTVNVNLHIRFREGYTIETLTERIKNAINEYFLKCRKTFGQDVNITLYVSDIIIAVKNLDGIIDCSNVSFVYNGSVYDERLTFIDEGHVGYQYLPYMGEVTIE